jgi:hypothetical protein
MEPVIGLYKGGKFDFTTEGSDDLTIEVVAHALSQLCRFTGHTDNFYSVAQHSVYTARLLDMWGFPHYALWGLLHDAPEAVYGDHSSPFKKYLNDRTGGVYRQVIEEIDEQVISYFLQVLTTHDICHYTNHCREMVKKADYAMLLIERDAGMASSKYLYPDSQDPSLHPGIKIADIDKNYEPWTSRRAEFVFTQEFERICKRKSGKAPASA